MYIQHTNPVEHGADVLTVSVLHEHLNQRFHVPAAPVTVTPSIVACRQTVHESSVM